MLLARIIASADGERALMMHLNGSGYLTNADARINHREISAINGGSRKQSVGHLALQAHRISVSVDRWSDGQRVEDRRDDHEQRRVGEVAAGTDPGQKEQEKFLMISILRQGELKKNRLYTYRRP